ncbi:MAG: S41 family peptidase [Casimicrobiaceae bacterium]
MAPAWRCFLRLASLAGALGLLGGCATLDPYNIVGRAVPPVVVAAGASDEAAKRAQREATLDLVWRTIAERYYRADLNGVDWARARERWAPLVLAAPSERDYWERLDRLTAELADAHTRVESPETVELRRSEQSRSLGLSLREIDGVLTVLAVHGDSDAWWAGVRPGMALVTIDGADALERWRQWAREARPTSSPQAALRLPLRALNRFAEASPDGAALAFRRHDGSLLETRLKPAVYSAQAKAFARRLPSGMAYLRFTAFRESLRARILELIRAHDDAPGLILDLRGNGGGSAVMVEAIASAFFRERALLVRTQTRSGRPVTIAGVPLIPAEYLTEGRPDAYDGPVAILIDSATASAAEALASALQANGRARVFGEASCGCLLAFLGYQKLPGGGELAYSEVGYTDVRGERIEGRGIRPDEPITLTRADLRDGRDRVLEAAVAWLVTAARSAPRFSRVFP